MKKRPPGGDPLRVVGRGEAAQEPPPPPPPPPHPLTAPTEFKSFVAAPPGWTAWFYGADEEYGDDPQATPIAGFATVAGKRGDYVVPLALEPYGDSAFVDPRGQLHFLMISGPEDSAHAYKRALRCMHRHHTWQHWRVTHREHFAPESICWCEYSGAELCALVANGLEPVDARCQCACHSLPFREEQDDEPPSKTGG